MEKRLRINKQIRVGEVRLLDEEGKQLGVLRIEAALKLREDKELDLVEISPTASPPVCKLMDYGKYKFEQKKRTRDARKKQSKVHVKEIKLRPKIDEHDYQFKLKHVRNFIEKGDKIKISMQFRGREMVHMHLGEEVLERMRLDLGEDIVVERNPQLEGRQMIMIVVPTKTNTGKEQSH